MAKDRRKLQHIHSSIPDKQPTPQTLEVGEIAVNNYKDQEFLSIKNSNDKVVRFSSDEQIVTWMEKKEVMPYEGYTRGSDGPTGATGPNSVTNDDLLQNKSNLIIKLNQVAAENTVKHDKVNGSKDIYNNLVNPTTDSGVTDGAGFAIDMSRYAMIDANPSFSSLTVTVQTDLSGNTTIGDGASGNTYGTDTGHTLTIKTTDVVDTNTNWTETITNKNETITNRNTIVGTESLYVSGTTTEVKHGAVSETNNSTTDIIRVGVLTETDESNVILNISGTTTENKKGDVVENNLSNKTENTTGNVIINTTGTTTETKTGNVTENHSGTTTENYAGKWTVNVTSGTEITSCSSFTINANDYKVKQCGGSSGSAEFDFCGGYKINTDKMEITQCSSAGTFTVTEKTTNLSGESLTIRESGATDFSGNTLTATTASNANVTIGGNLTEKISGTTSIDRKGNVTENNQSNVTLVTSGATTETKIGNVIENHSGTTVENNNGNVTINNLADKTENTTGAHSIYSSGNTCVNSQANANFYGNGSTNIGVACDGSTKGSATTVYGTTTTISANTLNETSAGNANINVGGNLTENVTGTTTINRTDAVVENNKGGLTVTTTGKTCMQSTTDVNIGGDSSTNIGVACDGSVYSNNVGIYAQTAITETANTVNISGTSSVNVSGGTSVCISAGTNSNIYGPTTNVGVSCGGSTASTINVSGATINEGGTTLNETFTNGNLNIVNYDLNGTNICISGSTKANVYGATTNVGIDCNNTTTAGTINISGTSINEGGKNINMYTTEKTCIQAGTDLNIGGDTTTNVGAKCDGTVYSNNTTINAQTAVTINAPVTNITGDTYLSGKTYFNNTCSAVTVNELSAALCEIKGRGELTMVKIVPEDPKSRMSAIYQLWQNGAQVGENIDVPKDGFLKNVTLVDVDGKYYLRFEWNTYNPDTQTYSTGQTDVDVEDLVKDIEKNNGKTDRGVNTDVWYNSTTGKMNVSADTTVKIVTDGNGTKTFTKSAGEHSLNSYKLTLTHNGLSNAVFDPFNASTALTLPHSALTIDYGVVVTGKTDDSYDTSAAKTVSIPTAVSHISRGKLKITHNGLTNEEFDPASDKSMTLPHSALTIDYNVDVRQKTDTSYNTSAAATVSIPGSLDHLSNYDGTNINIGHPTNINGAVCVTGTVTASGAIYSSDKNLKENINSLKGNKSIFDKVADVDVVSFNFKDDENKNTKYGVIAQDVQKAGLDELVYENNGNLGVDYTSLLMLKIAYLESTIKNLTEKIEKLENK